MRVEIRGTEDGAPRTYRYDLHDRYDEGTATSSMARTTGYTCTAAVHYVLEHPPESPGVYPPEAIGRRPGAFAFVRDYLAERNVPLRPAD